MGDVKACVNLGEDDLATLCYSICIEYEDPQAWLADVLARINEHRITDIGALLPWRWAAERERRKLAA